MSFDYYGLSQRDSSSSDEEDCHLPFWNDWFPPPANRVSHETDSSDRGENTRKSARIPEFSPGNSLLENLRHGNWIPPVKFPNASMKRKAKAIQERHAHYNTPETVKLQNCENHERNFERRKTPTQENFTCVRGAPFGWRERMQLHDVTKFSSGDLIWGIVNLGVFAHIKLWINEYGNMCASADGTISKLGSREETFISIINAELIRKMLGLSSPQWASLCETVQETKSTLQFDAFQDFGLTSKTALEKLWFFICKRRHFLPDQCMLVKLSGAVKCMKKFRVIPKLIVQDIRNISEVSVL